MPRQRGKGGVLATTNRTLVKRTVLQEMVPNLHVTPEFMDEFEEQCKCLLIRAMWRTRQRLSKRMEKCDA